MNKPIADIRKEYTLATLELDQVAKDPISQFKAWFEAAIKSDVNEPNAMCLSTINSANRPSARIVLLKGVEDQKFIFYTNYDSQKGKDLINQPFAALTFFWPELERQVRIEGSVQKVSSLLSDDYFNSRPKGSQLGAWASPQSQKINSRSVLESNLKDLEKEYQDRQVPRPPHWGGFALTPDRIEFWQGRASRLHDRVVYEKKADTWHINRLAP